MGSWFSSNINLQKDFNDALVGLEIKKDELTEENFSDKIFFAIDDKYPKKKTKSDFDKIIAELKEFNKKFWQIQDKYPGNNEKLKLKEFIMFNVAKIEKIIDHLIKSKEKVMNNTANNSIIAPEPSAPQLNNINNNAPLAKPQANKSANNSIIAPEPSAPQLNNINNNAPLAKPNNKNKKNNAANNTIIAPAPSATQLNNINNNAPLAKPQANKSANNSKIAPEPSALQLGDIKNNPNTPLAKPNANNSAKTQINNAKITPGANPIIYSTKLSNQNTKRLHQTINTALIILKNAMEADIRKLENSDRYQRQQFKKEGMNISPPKKMSEHRPDYFKDLVKLIQIYRLLSKTEIYDISLQLSKYIFEEPNSEKSMKEFIETIKKELKGKTDEMLKQEFNTIIESLYDNYDDTINPEPKKANRFKPRVIKKSTLFPIYETNKIISGGSRKKSKKSHS